MKLTKVIQAEMKVLEEEIKAQFEGAKAKVIYRYQPKVESMLYAWFNSTCESYPHLEHVEVRGYTPEWNDGEECYHSDDVFVNFQEQGREAEPRQATWRDEEDYYISACIFNEEVREELERDLGGIFEDDGGWDSSVRGATEKECLDNLHKHFAKPCPSVRFPESFLELFRAIWGTNYLITIVKVDGEVKLKKEDYHCEY
jgi:hypothetical protein